MNNSLMIILALNVLIWFLVFWQKHKIKQNNLKLNSLKNNENLEADDGNKA